MKHGWLLSTLMFAALLCGCASIGERRWVREGFDATCGPSAGLGEAAGRNGASLDTLEWSPFGAPEQGWRIYAPRIAREIASRCAPDSSAFAARLARWQGRRGYPADGVLSPAVFAAMKEGWQAERPFMAIRAQGICPAPPDEAILQNAAPEESYGGKTAPLRTEALQALRRMRAAAQRQIAVDPQTLAVFSGYRSPQYDDDRCAREQNCQGVVRAQCSAHRTGLAVDLSLGSAPGYAVDASDGPNRLFQSQTTAYRWLVANAGRFGFVNYVFEPWHWEWGGAAN